MSTIEVLQNRLKFEFDNLNPKVQLIRYNAISLLTKFSNNWPNGKLLDTGTVGELSKDVIMAGITYDVLRGRLIINKRDSLKDETNLFIHITRSRDGERKYAFIEGDLFNQTFNLFKEKYNQELMDVLMGVVVVLYNLDQQR